MFDYLIVGAGFAGSVLAERLARGSGRRVLLVNRSRYQPAPVVNYPNEHAYTRITEFKWLTGQEHPKTSIVYEYPCAEGDPYYPVPQPASAKLYQKYRALADATPGVHFAGQMATYRYYNMDQVVAQALTLYAKALRYPPPQAITWR